ncbi:hypothetical protein Patl1_22368 [Pistacia atlantica]|uniref:Uncharacterized protein n=1 Tax=Pistacia atlantica TaxID=434234 RepID=A0ACC0ZWG2_9ROSI|nr:hypothetical protein Patl1_22368 [Pistacia atlantica]
MNRSSIEIERKILRLLHGHKTRTQLTQIHAHFLRHGLHHSNQILSHFVSVCESLNLFSAMKSRGIWPDEYTFSPLLKACVSVSDVRDGQCVHGEVIRSGFECFGSVRIGVVELDVIVWNLMIRGFCKRGDVEKGLHLFREMSERSVVSWNSMISYLSQSGMDSEALKLFHEMRDQGFELDEATIVSVLPVCARLGAVDVGEWIHSYAKSSGLYQNIVSVENALVDFYCKCGILETARKIFSEMPKKNVISWNAMISGLAFNGRGELGVEFFEQMMTEGLTPNPTTFLGVLTCCAHAGMVEKGWELFALMTERHHVEPNLEHYGCMVDVLGRSGCVREAYELITSMSIRPNATLWGALLSACRTHGDVELAEHAVKELINLEPWNSGNYVLLSNIYAEEGKWDGVEKVRVLMREKSIKKSPGESAIR